MFSSIRNSYRDILSLFVHPEGIDGRDVSRVDPQNPTNYVPLKKVHVGGPCKEMLENEPLKDEEVQFRKDYLTFLMNSPHR